MTDEAPTDPPSEPSPAADTRRERKRRERAERPKRGFGQRLRRLLLWSLLVFLLAGPSVTLIYRFVPPPTTILMLQGAWAGRGIDYRWRPLPRLSPYLPQAAVAAEDSGFCSHNGFELDAMRRAYERNQRAEKRGSSKVRGGSTISQQTAKNVFLWPQRSYVRKGLEATFTVLIEALWGKRRIMEVYLNVAEFGPGLYGAEAASQRYFGKPAARLTRAEAARLIAVLPSPRKWRVERPGRYVARRSRAIRGRSGVVGRENLAACVAR